MDLPLGWDGKVCIWGEGRVEGEYNPNNLPLGWDRKVCIWGGWRVKTTPITYTGMERSVYGGRVG